MSNAYIEERLREVDKSWNVMTISACIMQLLEEDPDLNLNDIEGALRNIESKTTYLVAMPKSLMPPDIKALRPPHGAPADYALWICINGRNDLLDTLHKFGMTEEGNLDALRVCGFMVKS